MANNIKKNIAKTNNKSYLAKDFTGFRNELLDYAKSYFPNQIQDFTEASMGGLLLEMAAYVGDTMSFYLDYQFNELNPSTAIEVENIENHAKNAGVKISGAAPAVCTVTFLFEVPAKLQPSGEYLPDPAAMPTVRNDTLLISNSGVTFQPIEEIDFSEVNKHGVYFASYTASQRDANNFPSYFIVARETDCVSGGRVVDTFSIPNVELPFRELVLGNQDISQIMSVKDSEGNNYYEVESLTQDTVFKRIQNLDNNRDIVSYNLEPLPAPRRFIKTTDFRTKLTTIQFGGGDGESLEDDIIPDLTALALPLYGKKVINRFSIDPNALLRTKTLGIYPKNTSVTVDYRFGGGLSHNVESESIRSVQTLSLFFPRNPSEAIQNFVIQSIDVKNNNAASGGAAALDLVQLRSLISSYRNQQSRIVTQQDLLARIYTLPSEFGRVYRAGVRRDPKNPLSSQVYLISQNIDGNLVVAPDVLKKNLKVYLNEFRIISDGIDILDATVVDYGINFAIVTTPDTNKSTVISNVIEKLKEITDLRYYQIDQPIVESDIINVIINVPGVLSLIELKFKNFVGTIADRQYSDFEFNMVSNSYKGLIVGPPGSIFEIRFPEEDIIGSAE